MMQPESPTLRQRVRGYLVLPHAVPILVVMAATASFALIAAGGWPGVGQMGRLLGAMLGAQVAIGAVNELVDADLDRLSKPHKPIAAGLVSPRGARTVVAVGLVLMIALSLSFGVESLLLCAMGTGTGIAYSLWTKRTIWSWIPYLVALPLLPIWVWSAMSGVSLGMFAIYPIGVPAIIAVQIAQSLPDIDADRNSGVRTLAVALGATWARHACWGGMLLAASLAAVLAMWLTDHPDRVWTGAVVALGLVGLNAGLWVRDARSGVMACFPCVSIAAAVLGVAWMAALVSF
jgi:4-hydroxybenzoate polyprenyltransferase